MDDVEVLYRPVGASELELIRRSGWRCFPPRLPHQPIFYPVREKEYAEKIAREWNAKTDGVGYVTQFAVDRAYLGRFRPEAVGGSKHTEYWIPAAELELFNEHIVGQIEVIQTFRHPGWRKAYDLVADRETIEAVQRATLTTADFGLVPDVALFGSDDWWQATADGRIPVLEVRGTIARLFVSGHGDWPLFEVDANGERTQWTRFGDQSLYREGRGVRVEYVMQRTKKPGAGKSEQPKLLRIYTHLADEPPEARPLEG